MNIETSYFKRTLTRRKIKQSLISKPPLNAIASRVNDNPSTRCNYPSYYTCVLKNEDIPAIRDFADSGNIEIIDLAFDLKTMNRKKSLKKMASALQSAGGRNHTVFIFGFETLAAGRISKSKHEFLSWLLYFSHRYFSNRKNLFLFSTLPYVQNIKPFDSEWFFGRLRVFNAYTNQPIQMIERPPERVYTEKEIEDFRRISDEEVIPFEVEEYECV